MERIASLDYDYECQPKQTVSICNLCGSQEFEALTKRDRYGYSVTAVVCKKCGLVFLDPKMTADAYSYFYSDVYRPLVSAYHGRNINARTIQDEQRQYAAERVDVLAPFLENKHFTTLLDIGGSTGVVAHVLTRHFGLVGTVLDPAPLEIEEAKQFGLETVSGLVEQYKAGGRRFDTVVMCQTVDHLLNIASSLRAIRALINPEGVFYVDIVDFQAVIRKNLSVEKAVKIDHPYYLTQSTMKAYLDIFGFSIAQTHHAVDQLHIGYVCRPTETNATLIPSIKIVNQFLEEVRTVRDTSH